MALSVSETNRTMAGRSYLLAILFALILLELHQLLSSHRGGYLGITEDRDALAIVPTRDDASAINKIDDGTDSEGEISARKGEDAVSDISRTNESVAHANPVERTLSDGEPILFDRSDGWNGTSHEEGAAFCRRHGGRAICPYLAYCPRILDVILPETNREALWSPMASYGGHQQDVWVSNDDCRQRGGRPEESLDNQLKYIMCCREEEKLASNEAAGADGKRRTPVFDRGGDGKGREKVLKRCKPPKEGAPKDDDMVLVVMCNRAQAKRVARTVWDVRTKGNYTGDVVVMHNEDDLPAADAATYFIKGLEVELKSFPKNVDKYVIPPDLPGHGPRGRGYDQETAWIYFFKFHVLDPYFAGRWCRVLFLDGGIRARGDITKYLAKVYPADRLYAHSDGYPRYRWKLHTQFAGFKRDDFTSHPYAKFELMEKYDLEVDYPQSTALYFNTETVITDDPGVKERMYDLQRKWPVGKTLDQAYFALYYTNVRPIWEELPEDDANGIRFYDYCHERAGISRPVLLSKSSCGGRGR